MRMARGPERNRLIRQIITSIRCAVCGERYDGDDVRLLGRRDELWVMRVVCETCSTQGLVFALVRDGQPTVEWHELTPREQAKFEHMAPLGMDEVLDMRRMLDQFEGDIETLLNP